MTESGSFPNFDSIDSIEEAQDVLSRRRDEVDGVSIVNSADSLRQFHNILEALLEDDDPNIRNNAQYVSSLIDQEKIGVVCEEGIDTDEYDPIEGSLKVARVMLKTRIIPIFVISPSFNMIDLMESMRRKTGVDLNFLSLDPESLRNRYRTVVIKAVETMAFAFKTADSTGDQK